MTPDAPVPAPIEANVASALVRMARQQPYTPAIFYPMGRDRSGRRAYTHYTYRQLDDRSDAIAAGLQAVGVGKGVRTVMMVRPSLEFFALFFGLFKAGAVPVLVDPGIGIKRLKICLGESAPTAFIGIPPAHIARIILGWARDTLTTRITVGRKLGWSGLTLDQVVDAGRAARESDATWTMPETAADDMAAILFTSGSTGVPKGVIYRHRTFSSQVEMIRDAYDIRPGEVDLPTFPPFALFDPALGMTTVIPDMDPTRPAEVDPENIFEAIRDFGVTNMFGSPALLNTVGRYGAAHGVKLPTLERVISAGAPVSPAVMKTFLGMLPNGARIHTPYGATENLPVATVDSELILTEAAELTAEGAGVCVGYPLEQNDVRIIGIDDEPIALWSDALEVPVGTKGEITVRGPTTTQSYFNRDSSTRLAKIKHADDDWVRHRMGDIGYFDDAGRLWFCGRKSHRVQTSDGTMFTVPCELVFATHPEVFRAALVGVPHGDDVVPVLIVEKEKGATASDASLAEQLKSIAALRPHTRPIRQFLFHGGFPVDIRHNAKINRPALALWAAGQLKGRLS